MDNRDRWWRTQVRLVSESLRKASKLPYDMGAHEHLVKLDDDVHVKKALNGNPFTTKAIQVISKFTT
jgi:hypothetical protein